MERHLAADCSVMTGRSRKASSSPKCSKPKCGKVLFAQIQCDVSLTTIMAYLPDSHLITPAEMSPEVLSPASFPEFTQLLFPLVSSDSSLDLEHYKRSELSNFCDECQRSGCNETCRSIRKVGSAFTFYQDLHQTNQGNVFQ